MLNYDWQDAMDEIEEEILQELRKRGPLRASQMNLPSYFTLTHRAPLGEILSNMRDKYLVEREDSNLRRWRILDPQTVVKRRLAKRA